MNHSLRFFSFYMHVSLFLMRQSKLGFVVTVVLRNKTDLSSDEVELGVTLHTSRALEDGGGKEKQDVTQHAELGRVTFNSSAKEKIFQAIFKQTFIIQEASWCWCTTVM